MGAKSRRFFASVHQKRQSAIFQPEKGLQTEGLLVTVSRSSSYNLAFASSLMGNCEMKNFSVWFVASLAFCSNFAQADIFTGAGFALVDGTGNGNAAGTAFGNIVVAGNGGRVASIDSVTINGFTHTFIGDLQIDFRNVTTGAIVRLASPPDLTEANFNGNYTFSVNAALQTIDEAAIGKGDNDNIASGQYAIAGYGGSTAVGTIGPRTNFNSMTNLAIDGTWQLQVVDFFGPADTGAIASWSFNATITAVPEPSSMALLGGVAIIGGIYGFRRTRMRGQDSA